ncbi:heavy metal translocating P-type ATPase [Acanthopleuribacter pedis]|uniref:Heavy metal translocating P-type ATPase metal-binding domain-containing protein n=1 Tax=Acanthopleuribacter pedis TaxID=442870 RepID=A0A8J7U185_9BACT|nr:heavy metal translocating P-type ATPase [Acanthopleuribacter pedis]MBO1317898.1 heavy metal translocating P-type ATPase metal-binding domain-containing protein [Acanthopleuribacter pedis]
MPAVQPITQPNATDTGTCRHCGERLVSQQVDFCCPGCALVHDLIHQRGWHEYYRLRALADGKPNQNKNNDLPSFAYLGTEVYYDKHCGRRDGLYQGTWYLEGLHCAACVWLVEKLVQNCRGVVNSELYFGSGKLVLFFEAGADLEELARLIAAAGYQVGLQPRVGGEESRDLLRLGISGALAGNIMLMSLPFYTGLEQGGFALLFAWVAFTLTLPLLFYGAAPFFKRAWLAVRLLQLNLDIPIVIGLMSAFVLSTVSLLQGHVHGLYFDSMGMLVFFLLTGRYVQNMGVQRALRETQRLLAAMPQLVSCREGDTWVEKPVEVLKRGDQLRFRAGDLVPVDGILDSDEGLFNLHVVSGEADPVTIKRGGRVLAGSVNLASVVEIILESGVDQSQFARFQEKSQQFNRKKQQQPIAEAAARWFLPAALSAALLGFVLWYPSSPAKAFSVALTVLIVVCPCALALAEPTARAWGLSRAAQAGLWIKRPEVFEQVPRVKQVVFDKTGVITEGLPTLLETHWFHPNQHWLKAAICELEQAGHHPLANMFLSAWQAERGPVPTFKSVTAVKAIPGVGVRGEIDGREVVVCSLAALPQFAERESCLATASDLAAGLAPGRSATAAVVNGRLAALFTLVDALGEEVPEAMKQLEKRGLVRTILSGDRQDVVDQLTGMLALDQGLGERKPEQKLAYIEGCRNQGCLMVGDGLNDMGALAAADVGVTHALGTGAALEFADVVLRRRDLTGIDSLFDLADRVKAATRRGLALSLGYNTVAVALSLAGLIGPLIAAVLMPLSSLSVIAVSAWTLRQRSR